MCTSQEEADTILMLHAIDEASQNENAAIHILSTDTDVLILPLTYFPRLGAKTCIHANWLREEQGIDCTETNL